MSNSASVWARTQPVKSSNEKLVLMVLASHVNDKSLSCWPSITTLAIECHLDRRTVQRSLKRLTKIGLIRGIPRFIATRSATSNEYFFPVADGSFRLREDAGIDFEEEDGNVIRMLKPKPRP